MACIDGELSLAEAAAELPRRANHRKIHVDTIKNWILKGRGGVKLEGWRRGGLWFTSRAALERFRQQLSQLDRLPPRTDQQRTAAAEQARAALRRKGFYGARKRQEATGGPSLSALS